jgi:sulfate adenylyltransferase subunit 1
MVTGASTADVAIVLIDARNGIVEQTKRHSYIASLLQIPNVIIAINKMDLVDFSEEVYSTIKTEYEKIATTLKLQKIYFIPISARDGDNVVDASTKTPWYNGVTLLHLLETIPVHNIDSKLPARFPVQYIIEQDNDKFPDYKGYAGRVSGGVFRVGDTILALPSNRLSTIKAINEGSDELNEAFTPQSVTIQLDSNLAINRGDMLVKLNVKYPKYSSIISLHVCWLNVRPLNIGGKYIVRHTTDETLAIITDIRYKVNINTLENIVDEKTVFMNDIAHITIKTQKPLKYDDYSENRITGSLVLIDKDTFETVGAGMIVSDEEFYSYNI